VGLRHPSTVRVSKLLAIDKQIVKRVIGDLVPDDLARVDTILRQALGVRAQNVRSQPAGVASSERARA